MAGELAVDCARDVIREELQQFKKVSEEEYHIDKNLLQRVHDEEMAEVLKINEQMLREKEEVERHLKQVESKYRLHGSCPSI